MFFEPRAHHGHMREMILAETRSDRRKAVMKLLPFQKKDFLGIFKAMAGKPVTVRLLDPPLHEFVTALPGAGARAGAITWVSVLGHPQARIEQLHELNPMLGHRGCRLGITYPEITEMQATAILEAAAN
jgi:pyruvate,orthophosphate dikinase